MKECEGIALELPGYVNGKLDAGELGPVRTHLQSCGGCRDEVRRLEYLEALLREHLPVIEPSPTFASSFANRLAAEVAAEEGRGIAEGSGVFGWLFRPWLIPVAAAAALGALLVAPWLSPGPEEGSIVPQVTGSREVASVAKELPAGETKRVHDRATDTKVAAVSPAQQPEQAAAAPDEGIETASTPPEDVVERPELFVDFAVIRDLDVLEGDSGQSSDKTG